MSGDSELLPMSKGFACLSNGVAIDLCTPAPPLLGNGSGMPPPPEAPPPDEPPLEEPAFVPHLVEDEAQAAALEVRDPSRLCYVTQTTLSMDDTRQVIEALKRRFPNIAGPKKKYFPTLRAMADRESFPIPPLAGVSY